MESREGHPIFMESILSSGDYAETAKRFPNTFQSKSPRQLSDFKIGEFKCRWRMGLGLLPEEIKLINIRLEQLKMLVQ